MRCVSQGVLITLCLGTVLVTITHAAPLRAGWRASAYMPRQAQGQRKPNIETQDDNAPDPKPAPKATSARPTKTASRKAKETRRELPSDYAVVLATNAPEADIQVDGDTVGKAGKDGRLPTRIKPG